MHRLSITFSDELFAQLEKNAALKKISISSYVALLAENGIRHDETSEQRNPLAEPHPLMLKIFQKNLESQYLIRYLIESLMEQHTDLNQEVFNLAKEKAKQLLDDTMSEIK